MTEEKSRPAGEVPEKTSSPKRRRIAKKKADTESVPLLAKANPVEEKILLEGAAAPIGGCVSQKPDQAIRQERPHKEVPEQFLADLALFANILEMNPAVMEQIREVFEYHLIDPIDRKTFPKVVNAVSMLFGPSATMVVMTACHVNSAIFFEDLLYAVKDEKSRGAVGTIQHLTALYGNRVQLAYTLSSGTMDEDWHTVDVNTYRREGDNPYWIVNVSMMLYSGKETRIKMTPDSIFQLVEILSAELGRNIPVRNVDPGLVKKCGENLRIFYEKFYGGKSTEDQAEEKSCGKEEHPAGYA
ncbi:MAG: hypothetical protein LBU24_03200 [Methanocalculaceae archaeon]|jgi:hypothetical protein|nr:hypothetical protein [Methanocalculaceae archaeon]